jgi:hypothetical protein
MRLGALAVVLTCALPAAAQEEGMLPRWEVVEIAKGVEQHAQSVRQILEQVRPKEWIQDGAPSAYGDQHETLSSDIANLQLSAEALERTPNRLSVVVDTFLWLDRSQSMLRSISAGVRKYQNPAVADLLDTAGGINAGAIEKLKGYMRDLAASSEEEMEIAHEEAQRCRGDLFKGRPRRD